MAGLGMLSGKHETPGLLGRLRRLLGVHPLCIMPSIACLDLLLG